MNNTTNVADQSKSYDVQANNIWKYVSPILIIFGTLGNVLTIYVLSRKTMWKMASSPYFLVLGVADIVAIFSGLFRQWLIHIINMDIRLLSTVSCKLNVFLVYTFADFSVWILVAISVERFVAVCFPFKAKVICTRRSAGVILTLTFICLTLINCHLLYGFGPRPVNSTDSPVLSPLCSAMYPEYLDFYVRIWPWIDLSIFSLVPFCIIIVCNITLINHFRNPHLQGHTSTSSITVLLISLNTLFLVTSAPISIYLIGYPVWIENATADEEAYLKLWWAIVNMLVYLNNSSNFVFYCLSSPRFRQELNSVCNRTNRVSPSVGNTPATATGIVVSEPQQEERRL